MFVNLIAFSEAGPLMASVTLFLFFKIIAVEWDMPNWRAITITGLSPPLSSITFNFACRSITQHGLETLVVDLYA